MRPIILFFALTLVGCPKQQHSAKPAAPLGEGQAVSAAGATANAAQTAAAAAEAARLSKVRANIDAAAAAPHIEASPVALNELTVAQGRLSDVLPDPAEQADAAERRAQGEAGRAEEARSAALAAAESGKRDAVRVRELQAEAERLQAARDRLEQDFIAQADRNRVENQKAIEAAVQQANEARNQQRNAMLHEQAAKLTWIGIGCISAAISVAVLVGFFGGILVLRKVALYLGALALVGFLFLGAAQIVAQPWFMWACAGGILVMCVWFGVWAWRHQKRGDLAEELQARAGKVAAVAQTAVPVLDKAYEDADASMRTWLDEHIFDRLSSAMNRDEKATVHEIRKDAVTRFLN